MRGQIFLMTLRRGWFNMVMWGIGLGVLVALTISFVPNMDVLRQYQQLFSTLPSGVLQAFGINAGEALTPDNFLVSFLFSRLSLFLAVYAVWAGLNITANEEDEGIMDTLMALPLARHVLMGERLLAHYVLILGIVGLTSIGLIVGSLFVSLEFNIPRQILTVFSLAVPITFIMTITAFFGVLVRYRGRALAAAAVFVIGSFFLDTLGQAVSEGVLPTVRRLSFFAYNTPADMVNKGVQWSELAIILLVIGLLTGGALYLWQRRDIGL